MPSNAEYRNLYAELQALERFDWIIGDLDVESATADDYIDPDRILVATHAAHAAEIEGLKAEIAPDGDASRVNFLVLDGELWARTAMGREARRAVP
jgi:hypothetical protein